MRLWIGPALRLPIFLVGILVLAACGNDEVQGLKARLADKEAELQSANAQKSDLMKQNSQLQTRMNDLQVEASGLKLRLEELTQWSKQVAQQYGPGIWYFGRDERPLPYKSMPGATVRELVEELNRLFGRSGLPAVILDDIVDHTAHVRLSDAETLTQNMGSTGATAYLEVVTYTLTSLKDIHFVHFNYREGDHAVPGRYSR